MADEAPFVETEIDDHKTDLNKFVEEISSLTIPDSRKNVVKRFVRDCETLISDVDKDENPNVDDLCDFNDRKNSLEIIYHNITRDL